MISDTGTGLRNLLHRTLQHYTSIDIWTESRAILVNQPLIIYYGIALDTLVVIGRPSKKILDVETCPGEGKCQKASRRLFSRKFHNIPGPVLYIYMECMCACRYCSYLEFVYCFVLVIPVEASKTYIKFLCCMVLNWTQQQNSLACISTLDLRTVMCRNTQHEMDSVPWYWRVRQWRYLMRQFSLQGRLWPPGPVGRRWFPSNFAWSCKCPGFRQMITNDHF